jgi:F420-dependent oxidoreductase-like protein
MRFGAFVPQGWRLDLVGIPVEEQWETMLGVATTIEASGYESLWVFDHFHTVPVPTQEVTYEAWTLMAALAVTTRTVRLGQMCTCNSYRLPSYLAKVAASIDALSGGRVEMGIGAGWYEHEYKGYGYPFDKPSVRIGRLRESVEIMQKMWTEDHVSYQGTHYQLDGAICQPKPVQDPHIPFWIAGGGEQLTLNVAARYAQYTNFGQDVELFVHKSEVLAKHCATVGSDYDAIVRSSNFTVLCVPDEATGQAKVAWFDQHFSPFVDAESARNRWGIKAMTPDQIVDMLTPWKEAGMSYAIMNFPDAAYDRSGIELFAREVIPALA